jgi:hypothetical protein
MNPKATQVVFTFRIDPGLKEAAKKGALQARLTVSTYVRELIRLDLWRKGLLGLANLKMPGPQARPIRRAESGPTDAP